jgi:hypothetical protein
MPLTHMSIQRANPREKIASVPTQAACTAAQNLLSYLFGGLIDSPVEFSKLSGSTVASSHTIAK